MARRWLDDAMQEIRSGQLRGDVVPFYDPAVDVETMSIPTLERIVSDAMEDLAPVVSASAHAQDPE
ncbi:hypothetical protein HOK31_12410 [Candidatus Poribacteria bacterium]|nr:hypothetical protein [Candidatus Poribacteria bacterium]